MFPKIVGFPPQIIQFSMGFSTINHPFWGTTIFGNTQDASKIGPQFSGLMPSEIMDSASRNIEFWVPQRRWETSTKGAVDIPKKVFIRIGGNQSSRMGMFFFSPIPKMGERIFRFSHKFNYRGYKKRGGGVTYSLFSPRSLGIFDPI